MYAVFAYGTLQVPEVMLAVTGKAFNTLPARLEDYSRHCLKGRSFPGIRPNPGHSVEGLLFLNIDADTLGKLDEFEDPFYRRDTVPVITADGNEWFAQAYIMREEAYGLLLPHAWSLETFQRTHLPLFLQKHA